MKFSSISTKTFVLLLLLGTLSGCASTTGGQVSSLEDLSTDSVKEGLAKIPQYRVTSIPGWLPFADVGGLYFYKPSRKPGSVIGLSPDKSSFEVVSEVLNDCPASCLAKIRTKILDLSIESAKLIQKRLDLLFAQTEKPEQNKDAIKKLNEHYQSSHDDFNKKYKDVVEEISHNGVFIYRWDVDSQQSGHLGLDSLLRSSLQTHKTSAGFALVSGLRIKTLYVGSDLLDGWPTLNKESEYKNRFEITTHTMQGKHIMYGTVVDFSSYFQANMEASAKQLANLPQEIQALAKIEFDLTLTKISNLSNMGVMGNIKRTVIPINWNAADQKKRYEEKDGWLTFFSVTSDYTDLLDLLKPKEQPSK